MNPNPTSSPRWISSTPATATQYQLPQCQKALVRSKLWDASTQIPRTALPTVGEMMTAITQGEFDGKAYDEAYPERLRQTIY